MTRIIILKTLSSKCDSSLRFKSLRSISIQEKMKGAARAGRVQRIENRDRSTISSAHSYNEVLRLRLKCIENGQIQEAKEIA